MLKGFRFMVELCLDLLFCFSFGRTMDNCMLILGMVTSYKTLSCWSSVKWNLGKASKGELS